MTQEEIVKVLKSITYKGHKAKGMIFISPVWYGDEKGYDVRVRIDVKDRVTGEDAGGLYTHYTYGPEEVERMTPSNIVRRVKSMLIYLESHEVDENLLYKGRRVFDPHREKLEGPFVKRELKKHNAKLIELKKKVIEQLKENDNAIPHAKEN
jgi:hypothetical protein